MGKTSSTGFQPGGLRAFRATVLALLVGVLGLASVGFAGEQGLPVEAQGGTEIFGVPAPHVADRASYEVTMMYPESEHDGGHGGGHHGGHGKSLGENPGHGHDHGGDPSGTHTVHIQWAEPGELYDRNGAHHHTNALVMRYGTGEERPHQILHLDQANGATVGVTDPKRSTFTVHQQTPTGPTTYTETSNWTTVYDPFATDDHKLLVPCGLLNPLQGTPRNLSMPVAFAQDCGVWGWNGVAAARASYVLDRFEEMEGARVAVLALDPSVPIDESLPRVTEYRFREDLPYPLTLRIEAGSMNATVELVDFERGDIPLGTSASSQPPMPALSLTPSPRWGLDDAGVHHPYPLRTAWEDALADPRSGLRDYLEANPHAYTTFAEYDQYDRDATSEHVWRIVVTGGAEPLTVCPGRTTAGGGLPSAPGTAVETMPTCPHFNLGGPADYEPSARPTVASMHHVWAHLAPLMGVEVKPNAYGFLVHGDSEYLTESVWVGFQESAGRTAEDVVEPVLQEPSARERAEIRFTPDGRLEAFSHQVETRTYGDAEEGIPSSTSHRPASTGEAPRILGATFAPSVQEAGAVGGLAVGAAALYWLWPWLNQVLFAPLFSRIQKPKVLDHERRQRIAAAVSAEPGVHFEELQRRTGLARGALRHHLQMLVDNDVVGLRRTGGYTCYYPRGEIGVDAVDAQVAARSPTAQKVLEAWQADPEATPSGLAERLGLSRQSVHYHVKRLRLAGLAP